MSKMSVKFLLISTKLEILTGMLLDNSANLVLWNLQNAFCDKILARVVDNWQ